MRLHGTLRFLALLVVSSVIVGWLALGVALALRLGNVITGDAWPLTRLEPASFGTALALIAWLAISFTINITLAGDA